MPAGTRSPYDGRTAVFATRHGKHQPVGEALAGIGLTVTAPADLDTDRFGTFTGEVPRTLSPVDAARAKVRLAAAVTAHPYVLASEASYAPLPLGLPGHEELLLFTDTERGIEVIEIERVLTSLPAAVRVGHAAEAEAFLAACGFGAQAIIVRPAAGGRPADTHKGITTRRRFTEALAAATRRSPDGRAVVEPDLRAMNNPTRQEVLRRLGRRLARRLATPCPDCGCPGFGRTGTRPGLSCAACGTGTPVIAADVHKCARCPHRTEVAREATVADPQWSPSCNP